MPVRCPPGYNCNSEGLITPEVICRIGYICLGDVGTGLAKQDRSCMMLETVGTEFPCSHGRVYSNETNFGGWPHIKMPEYFSYEDACCNNGAWLAEWLRDIGEAIN